MWNLGCDIMKSHCGDETDDCIWETKANRNQIWVGYRWQFHQSLNAPAHLFDDALISERIKHVACDPMLDSFAHSKLAAVLAEDFFRSFFHFDSRQKVTIYL